MDAVKIATIGLFERYQDVIASAQRVCDDSGFPERCRFSNLLRMCATAISDADALPLDKLSHWLGFIQGVLADLGLIDVDEERDFSRPLCHAACAATDVPIPRTRSLS